MSKPGLKRPSTEERTQLTKFILMSPSSSCPSSNAALPKLTSPLPSPHGSRILFIGEPAAMSPDTTHIGGIPKQVPALGIAQPTVATSCSGEGMKTVLALGQHLGNVKSESLSNLKNFTLPSGRLIWLSLRWFYDVPLICSSKVSKSGNCLTHILVMCVGRCCD